MDYALHKNPISENIWLLLETPEPSKDQCMSVNLILSRTYHKPTTLSPMITPQNIARTLLMP